MFFDILRCSISNSINIDYPMIFNNIFLRQQYARTVNIYIINGRKVKTASIETQRLLKTTKPKKNIILKWCAVDRRFRIFEKYSIDRNKNRKCHNKTKFFDYITIMIVL